MRQIAVLVTDRQILPARAGNHIRILGLVRGLRELGWRVALIAPEGDGNQDIAPEVDFLYQVRARSFQCGDVARFDVRPYRLATEHVVKALNPAVAVAEYAWLAPALRRLPRRIVRVVDCHDVLHERTRRFTAAGLDAWVYCTPGQERRLLGCADVLLAIQHRETAVLRRLLPAHKVLCLLPYVELPAGLCLAPGATPVVLAVGARHAGNDGIKKFATDIWPTLLPHCPGARLHVVGSIGRGMPAIAGVEWLYEVDNLSECYRIATVVICPMEVGTGVKIKMLEALRHGNAVVATPTAAEGLLVPPRPAWHTANSLRECGEAVRLLLESPERRQALSCEALAYGEKHLSLARFLADLKSILPGPLARVLRHLGIGPGVVSP